jgi:hypothetical protein
MSCTKNQRTQYTPTATTAYLELASPSLGLGDCTTLPNTSEMMVDMDMANTAAAPSA